ncbi:hypothetical protein M758_10G143500 [Ceratodon purpureus]|nr:hypothetical protein M758_10G143500 [Ceratodon purpureus]
MLVEVTKATKLCGHHSWSSRSFFEAFGLIHMLGCALFVFVLVLAFLFSFLFFLFFFFFFLCLRMMNCTDVSRFLMVVYFLLSYCRSFHYKIISNAKSFESFIISCDLICTGLM